MVYATLDEVKEYMEIDNSITKWDYKFNLILNAINSKIAKLTNNHTPNDELKLAICMTVDTLASRKAGSIEEKEGDITIKFSKDIIIPDSVISFISDYIPIEETAIKNYATFI